MTATTTKSMAELMSRESNGISVALVWSRDSDSCVVHVLDAANGSALELEVGTASPLDVFHHPFAYAAHRGLLAEPVLGELVEAEEPLSLA
jgi:hypothetical protein